MMDTATTLATVPAILALVNLLKDLGLAGKWSALAAISLAVGITLADTYLAGQAWQAITQGIILGLGAAGLWDATKKKEAPRATTPR